MAWSAAGSSAAGAGAGSGVGLKDSGKPVAFGLLLLFCGYFFLELYLFELVDNAPPGAHLPISTNTSSSPCFEASPYCVINVKSLFLDVVDFYVHKPLSMMFNKFFHADAFVSADFVSFAHIIFALLSAKLVCHDSLLVRRLGVVLYETRNFLDCLDGVIAKEEFKRRGEAHLFSLPTGAWGYFIDGISDGIGSIFVVLACFVYLQRHYPQRKVQISYTPLNVSPVSNGKAPAGNCKLSPHRKVEIRMEEDEFDAQQSFPAVRSCLRKCWGILCKTGSGFPAFLFLNQLLLSSVFWNRNIVLYHKILEPIEIGHAHKHAEILWKSMQIEEVASSAIHTPLMWFIIYAWRLLNPLMLMDLLMYFIFFDKMYEFFYCVQYCGFMLITCLAGISEAHRLSLFRMLL